MIRWEIWNHILYMHFHEIIYLILSMVALDTNVIGNFAIQFSWKKWCYQSYISPSCCIMSMNKNKTEKWTKLEKYNSQSVLDNWLELSFKWKEKSNVQNVSNCIIYFFSFPTLITRFHVFIMVCYESPEGTWGFSKKKNISKSLYQIVQSVLTD